MNIRSAQLTDASAIAEVHVASWKQTYRGLLPDEYLEGLSVEKREGIWSDAIANDSPKILVVETEDRIVGFSAFGNSRNPESAQSRYEIYAIYLDSNYWSRGFGCELWRASEVKLAQYGASSVCLWVLADNARAIRFYRAAGFEPVANSEKSIQIGELQILQVQYVCSVGS